jgi:hypothetical protein
MTMRCLWWCVLVFMAGSAWAGSPDALDLADPPGDAPAAVRDWNAFVEGADQRWQPVAGGTARQGQRLSLDLNADHGFAPGWRAVFADRLDIDWSNRLSGDSGVNTLKELYVSNAPQSDEVFDLGRINVRNGVASGYNPTDLFRGDALRSVVSPDPDSLRDNRLGTVMLRAQRLWDRGSLTAIVAPHLTDAPSDKAWSPDLGATNRQTRWQLAATRQFAPGLSPQWLLSGGEGESPQAGANLTGGVNDATVVFFEWSGGRNGALTDPDAQGFHSRLASGATYTFPDKLSLTAEYEYNGAAPDRNGWNALRNGSPAPYGQYRERTADLQDLPTRDALFLYASWQDCALMHLDLTLLEHVDRVDHSRLTWLEARYHWTRVDLALQWQLDSGAPNSDFGAAPQRRVAQLVMRGYL